MRSLAHAAENTETENLGKPLGAEGRLGVQVVEGVGLVASGFQFFTRLGSVFAEEVGGSFFCGFNWADTIFIFFSQI